MKADINKLLNIKFGEKNKVSNILIFFSFTSFYMVGVETISQSLFNAKVGVNFLPFMFMFLAAGIALSTMFFYSLKVKNVRKFYSLLFCAFFIIHLGLFFLLQLTVNKILVVVFYLATQTVSSMLFTLIWLILQEVNDIESSKRIFPLASAGITLGFIVSGFFLKYFIPIFTLKYTFLLLILILPIDIIIFNNLLRKHKKIDTVISETKIGFLNSAQYIVENKFYIIVLFMGLLLPLIFFINDYLYNLTAKRIFIDEENISAFFGFFYIVNGLISLFIRLFIVSRAIIKFGAVKVTYFLIFLFLCSIILAFNQNIVTIFLSKLFISIAHLSFGVSLFNLYYQVADPKYRSKVILLLETAGTCSGMALGGFFTFLTTKDFFSITALNFVSVALLVIVLILWFLGYKGFFKTLQNNICEIEIGNINEIVGKNVSPYMERFLSDNLLNGTTPTKIITLDLIKEIEIKNKKNLILDSFKNGDISYKYKIIDYIFDKNANTNDLYSYLDYIDGVKSYFIYNLFVNYRFIFGKESPIFFEKINRLFGSSDEKNNDPTNNNEDDKKDENLLNSFPKNSETDEITLNFIFNPKEESFLKISDYFFNSNDKISILKLLKAIKNFPDFYKNSKPFIIKIYDKYFSDVDIMIQISSLISVYDDFDILKRFSERFYRYEIINAIKIDCKTIFDILSEENFLSNIYILSIASKSGKLKDSERFFEIALKVTDKLYTICAEETKIIRYFERNKSMILIDEIAEIKNTALSVLINFLLYYYNVLQIENIYNLLKSGEKEDYITDILQNVIPRNLNLKLKNIIKNDCKNINEKDFNYDVLKLGIENEALFLIYRYLGGVKMGEEVQNKLEKLITLKNIPLFEELNIDSLLLISSISEYADYEENRIVVNEGDSSDKFFVIIRGEVAVTKGEKELAVLKSGEIFGEMGVIDDAIRTATIKTKVKTLFLEIDGKNFVDLLKRYGSISFSVIRTISERLRTLLGKLR